MRSMIKVDIAKHYVANGRGVYVINSETLLRFNGSEEIGGFIVSRHFSEFRQLHHAIGARLGLNFDFSRMTGSGNPKSMLIRARGLTAYLRLLLKRSYQHGGNNSYHKEILAFLDVDLTKSMLHRCSSIGRGSSFSGFGRGSSFSGLDMDSMSATDNAADISSSTPSAVLYFASHLMVLIIRLMRCPFSLIDSWLALVETSLSPAPHLNGKSNSSISNASTEDESLQPSSSKQSSKKLSQTSPQPLLPPHPLIPITSLSPAATDAYNFLNPLVRAAGCTPLYVIPPGAVTSFKVEKPGPKPTMLFTLDSKYQRFINDIKPGLGPVTFDVTFSKEIRATYDNGSLVDLQGVHAKRLPLTINARVIKMVLPKAGKEKVVFVGKAGFLKVSLPISTGHFTDLQKWETTKKIEV